MVGFDISDCWKIELETRQSKLRLVGLGSVDFADLQPHYDIVLPKEGENGDE